jgi:hypothetical protein
MIFLDDILCGLGFHQWLQYEIIMIDPNNPENHVGTVIYKRCAWCGKRKFIRFCEIERTYYA